MNGIDKTDKTKLPIHKVKNRILSNIQTSQFLIVASPTGSGKTTQIPQFLLKEGWTKNGCIAVTQPRRVSTIAVSKRVASELNCKLGDEVGYSIRFEDVSSRETLIKYVTDGILIREMMADNKLSNYSVIILDEAHERSINTDILFAMIKEISKKRKDIKVIIMSATLTIENFSKYFDNAPVVKAEGSNFKVSLKYLTFGVPDYVDAAVTTILQIHTERPPGHILVFLTGQEEIERTKSILREKIKTFPSFCSEMVVLPIYAALSTKKQMKVFNDVEKGKRKIVLATNIAETSLTINDVAYVVDCGYSKTKIFNPKTGVDVMTKNLISKSEAIQRTGRAGRVCEGTCYRLYPESTFIEMPQERVPEILRADLSQVILMLKLLRVEKISQLSLMDSPDPESIRKAIKTLIRLGALDKSEKPTENGAKMAAFPLPPVYSSAIVNSGRFNAHNSVLTIISVLSSENIWTSSFKKRSMLHKAKKKFSKGNRYDDLLSMEVVYNEFINNRMSKKWCLMNCINRRALLKAQRIRNQLSAIFLKSGIRIDNTIPKSENNTLKSLLSGFFVNMAVLQDDKSYKTFFDTQIVKIHPSSVLYGLKEKPPCVVFSELVKTKFCYLKNVASVDMKWLPQSAPFYFRE